MATSLVPDYFASPLPYQPMRVSVERYHQLIRQGFFAENEQCELLEGVIVEKMTKHPQHAYATRKCYALLSKLLPANWHLTNQDPITLVNSEPEPDIAVVRGTLENYATRHPGAGDVALVIEVADSSLPTDRYKAGIYAAAGIPVYWIVNLVERLVEVYSTPVHVDGTWSYSDCRKYPILEKIPVVVQGETIAHLLSDDLMP
jgi:Uma2 family endonuclease